MDQEYTYLNISCPLQGNIQISFDGEKNVLSLIGQVFVSNYAILDAVSNYVTSRKNHYFKPYKTFFLQKNSCEIDLVQEIPFSRKEPFSLRKEIHEFWEKMKKAHRLLFEIALEEHLQRASSDIGLMR